MKVGKYIIVMAVAMTLYVVVSLILEGEVTEAILFREVGEGFIFGILYGVYLIIRNRFRKKERS
ncbi:hypothetical protein [Muriicola soli]|uniref:Uncharacterized protein n=1 Tax=Muriicola soli TaxID=2507538 RepID=A0A411EBB8_9FLAO|nr:hypothetical protein [Muriicola soli]QBA64817.1 hypothetical protein EQY75_09935 [Muriicola soli]